MSTQNTTIPRPPVIVVMGHIDHGKSTLLDYIRKTNITAKEAGGITQHVSAYEVELELGDSQEKRKMTFLDTPGHEAFCTIRERGARIADMAVLVVAADDGVKPQTIEALKCIEMDHLPFIVAINKIDKAGQNIDKVKQSLAEHGVLLEGWGGTIPFVPISAKTGEGVTELIEMIALQVDMEELKGDPGAKAEGFVIESNLSPKQGIAATLIIKNGTLNIGDFIASAGAYTPVRSIQDFQGENITEATFSSPVKIAGWDQIPIVGNPFQAFATKELAIEYTKTNTVKTTSSWSGNVPEGCACITLILKADTMGSLEAVEHELKKLDSNKVMVRVVSKGIGAVSESDIKTANIKKSLIIGFNVATAKGTDQLALRENIEIKNFNIIYELIDYLKTRIKEATPLTKVETMTGSAKIIRTFSKNKDKQVIGGKTETGEIKSGNTVQIFRRDAMLGEGKIKEIQSQKIKTSSVKEGDEFGMLIESKIEIVPGDYLKAISLVEQK